MNFEAEVSIKHTIGRFQYGYSQGTKVIFRTDVSSLIGVSCLAALRINFLWNILTYLKVSGGL